MYHSKCNINTEWLKLKNYIWIWKNNASKTFSTKQWATYAENVQECKCQVLKCCKIDLGACSLYSNSLEQMHIKEVCIHRSPVS